MILADLEPLSIMGHKPLNRKVITVWVCFGLACIDPSTSTKPQWHFGDKTRFHRVLGNWLLSKWFYSSMKFSDWKTSGTWPSHHVRKWCPLTCHFYIVGLIWEDFFNNFFKKNTHLVDCSSQLLLTFNFLIEKNQTNINYRLLDLVGCMT